MGCSGDAQKLMRDFGVACKGMVDLSEEANLRLCGPGSSRLPEKWSLARDRPYRPPLSHTSSAAHLASQLSMKNLSIPNLIDFNCWKPCAAWLPAT